MIGWVDRRGRALVRIAMKPRADAPPTEMDAWIDTGFTGHLVLPDSTVSALGLTPAGTVGAQLGDGSSVVMGLYTCVIEWFDDEKQVEAATSNVPCPLLGIGLLHNHKLTVDYSSRTLTIE